jgi:membrane dipeptidase
VSRPRLMPLLVTLLAAGALAGASASQSVSSSDQALVAKARAIHERVITIDTHADIPVNFATPEVDPGVRGTRLVDLPKMREGGLNVEFFVAYVGQGLRTPDGYAKARAEVLAKIEAIHRLAEKMHPDQIGLATSPADVERIRKSGRLVAAIGVENGYALGQDLSLVKTYYDLGARYLTLTHSGHNDVADSANPRQDEPEIEHNGLSEFGRRVVAEMNRLGLMVDLSHTSKKTQLDAMKLSRAPVIASHSGARAVNDNRRNMDDEALLALKANGGVLQCVALGSFVRTDPSDRTEALRVLGDAFGRGTALDALTPERRAEYDRQRAAIDAKWRPTDLTDFVNHVDHAVKLIGIDHVGFGSDFDGGGGLVGWRNAAESLNVTVELVRRGYTEEQIRKLWGGNLLRVWREVEKTAQNTR